MQSALATRSGRASRLLIAFATLWLSCGCAIAQVPAGADASIEKIRALIGDAACDSDAQCRTIAIGAKACGGPEYYLAWSTKRTNDAALRDALQGDGAVRRPEPPRPGMSSDCALVTDPGAYCASATSPASGAAVTRVGACRLRSTRADGRGPVD